MLLLKLLFKFINSIRIIILSERPNNPDQNPKTKYIILIFLWLVEYIHLIINLIFI